MMRKAPHCEELSDAAIHSAPGGCVQRCMDRRAPLAMMALQALRFHQTRMQWFHAKYPLHLARGAGSGHLKPTYKGVSDGAARSHFR